MSDTKPTNFDEVPTFWQESDPGVIVTDMVSKTVQSTVYKAKQKRGGQTVALKIAMNLDDDDIIRFKREAQMLQKLQHPNIGKVFSYGSLNGQPYMIMEWLQGETLSDLLKRNKTLVLQELNSILSCLFDALEYAHARGIIHRDIKPSNIFIERSAAGVTARLIDFGMARPINTDLNLTPAGIVLGSPAYMSPEQCTGQALDGRSDIYSLACVVYQCLTGHELFHGESNIDAMYKHLHGVPEPIVEHPHLSRIIMRCLEKVPEKRYQTIADLRKAWFTATKTQRPADSRRRVTAAAVVFMVATCTALLSLVLLTGLLAKP